MKRYNNLYTEIISLENLKLAEQKAAKGKLFQQSVSDHLLISESNLNELHQTLKHHQYRTSAYTTFKVFEPKEREVYRLPFFPDRITHHAIMNVLEPILINSFTADTYSCIKGRGIHGAVRAVKKALLDKDNTTFCLKLDIKKFYPSIDHAILKKLLRKKVKCYQTLSLLDEIIDSAPGLPIGNYLSQFFANYYLSNFDHWIKELKGVKYYFRYLDDIVILHSNKNYLHSLLADIKSYLSNQLNLTVKSNYQVFPVASRGVDFVGYVFFHSHILMRKSIKVGFARMMHYKPNKKSIGSYMGWASHCNSNHFLKKVVYEKLQRL